MAAASLVFPQGEANTDTSAVKDAAISGADARTAEFEAILTELRPDLFRYAFWLTHDPTVAEDAVQEALLRGWRSWHKLRDGQALKPWFLTIVRRECARIYARKRIETRDLDALSSAEQALIATSPDDAQLAELRSAMLALHPAYREPLVLQVIMGFSADEIADVMGIKRGAVLTRLCRARKTLAERLNGESLEGEDA